MEDECHNLDCTIAEQCDTATHSFASYLQSKQVLTLLRTETATLQREVNQAQQILTLLILTVTDPQHNQSVQTLSSLINTNIVKMRANVCTCILVIVLHYNLSQYKGKINQSP